MMPAVGPNPHSPQTGRRRGRSRKLSSMANPRIAAINSLKSTTNKYKTNFHRLNLLVVIAHPDWRQDGVAADPSLQTRLPSGQVDFLERCTALVEDAFEYQETFPNLEVMEWFRSQGSGIAYIREISHAFLQIIKALRALIGRAQTRERMRYQVAAGRFNSYIHGRPRGLRPGLAGGRGSPLRNASEADLAESSEHPGETVSWDHYIDNNLAEALEHLGETFSWDEYVAKNLAELGGDVGW